jgi:hypothetical protein
MSWRALLTLCLVLSIGGDARAHGGLPISEQIVRVANGDVMYVPTLFWGLWIGDGVGPWKWICEEELNPNRGRRFAITSDGTYYATNLKSITVSHDNGCTWTDYTGPGLSDVPTSDVAVDPSDPARAYVATAELDNTAGMPGMIDNALYVTSDHGMSFDRATGLDATGRALSSVLIAPSDPNVIYVTSQGYGPQPLFPAVHRSGDRAVTFSTEVPTYTLDGRTPTNLVVLAIDPRNADVIFVRAFAAFIDGGVEVSRHALLRSVDQGAHFEELWKMDGVSSPGGISRGIEGVAFDLQRGNIYVASAAGILVSTTAGATGPLAFVVSPALTRAQCVDMHNGSLYACSNNYTPDRAAIARSDDGALTFTSLLTYDQTKGPVDCPAGTPVGDMCPNWWLTYGPQLGVDFPDGGTDDGGGGGGGGNARCGATPSGTPGVDTILIGLALAALAALRLRGRSSRRDRSQP